MTMIHRHGELLGMKLGGWIGGVAGFGVMWVADAPGWARAGTALICCMLGGLTQTLDEVQKKLDGR